MSGADGEPNMETKLQAPPDFKGPTEKRHCTDILFWIAIVGLWVAMTVVGIDSIESGNLEILFGGIDYKGRICGYSANVTDKDEVYYVRWDGTGVCVDGCPSTTNTSNVYACVDEDDIPSALKSLPKSDLVLGGYGYCQYQYASSDVANYCIFDNSTLESELSGTISFGYIEDILEDTWTARVYIFGYGFGFALLISFLYLFLLRIPGVMHLLVWGSILLVFLTFAGLGAFGWYTAIEWSEATPQTKSDAEIWTVKICASISLLLGAIFLCIVCFMRKRILLAEGVCKEASKAMTAMPLIILFPVLQIVGFVIFMVPLVIYLLYTATLGDFETKQTGTFYTKTYSFSDQVEYRFWFFLFCFFWTSQFIIAMGQIVIAMAASTWYFTEHGEKHSVGSGTVISCTLKGMWYHSGTAAFGSLIIAIIKMIRAFVAYLQKKAKMSHNKIMQCCLCCCQCCFWCLEKCMKFLNKNAYIQTAIFSYKFCTAAKHAFFLIARNIVRVAAVAMVSEFLLVIAKILVSLGTVFIAYLILDASGESLNSTIGPLVLIFFVALVVAEMFTEVFGMIISTILQCFIADEEMFGGRFAEGDLKDFIAEHHDEKAEPML